MSAAATIQQLEQIDWNFSDYSSSQFPTDINSLHWYPAAFVPQIPAILINALSKPKDLILDPFSGSGTTITEASRLGRRFIGVDRNPYALHICRAKFAAIEDIDEDWFQKEQSLASSLLAVKNPTEYCDKAGILEEVFNWFEDETLAEILAIHQHIKRNRDASSGLLRQVVLSSILNRCCSQRDHYTYITDRCFPKTKVYRPAISMYREQMVLASRAVSEARRQFDRIHGRPWKPSNDGIVVCGDARKLGWIGDNSVDLVVTSPPYLGVNDYVRAMRLTWLFFSEEVDEAIKAEIGARRKRQRPNAFEEYKADMEEVFGEIMRILRPNGHLALVVGQGKGRVNRENTIELLVQMLKEHCGFSVLFQKDRRIKFRRIQVPGVGTEKILVLGR